MRLPVQEHATRLASGPPLCRRYVVARFDQVSVRVSVDGATQNAAVQWAIGYLRCLEGEVIGAWVYTRLDVPPDQATGGPGTVEDHPEAEKSQQAWCHVFDDMKHRGAERVRFAVGDDISTFREWLRTRFPGATALPSFADLFEHSLSRVAARHRARVREFLLDILGCPSGLQARQVLGTVEAGQWGAKYPGLLADWRLALEQGWALWTLAPTLRRELLLGDGAAAALSRSLRKAVARRGCFANVDEALEFVLAALARAERRLDASLAGAAAEHHHHRGGFRPRIGVVGV